ncbi:DUF2075 domain-containing protein [Hydrogenimonas sp.]
MQRAYYKNSINNFIDDSENNILGSLSLHHNYALEDLQKNAWLSQIKILKDTFQNDYRDGQIFFEFLIPRMGKRVDNIVIIKNIVFVIEFKIGSTYYDNYAKEQVLDYAVDLKNFHKASHDIILVPILCASEAENYQNSIKRIKDKLYSVLLANKSNLKNIIEQCLFEINQDNNIDINNWYNSIYQPTPTIIQAAQALYKGHNVKEISRSDAGAINLSKTSNAISEIIEYSKTNHKKSICFITGIPGAGKTLAGLNIAVERMKADKQEHAVFLSGNGPLVDVLREALTRDEVNNAKIDGKKLTKKEAAIKANTFIQNIHHFRDDALITNEAPTEKVVVFDEAQRAWNKEQTSKFMKQKKGYDYFEMSEPNFLISVMDRHNDWSVIVCLIGGGQEINNGEAGLEEWIKSLQNNFQDWNLFYSPYIITDKNYLQNSDLIEGLKSNQKAKIDHDLHLSVSVRSFRSEKLSEFIHTILDIETDKAKQLYQNHIKNHYPIKITRDFNKVKVWLKKQRLGNERTGIIASSGAYRLRPFGINIKSKIDPAIWFLNDKNDIRSSLFHEEIATEYDIQGLELDYTCVCWDGDFYFDNNQWIFKKFSGTKWKNINQEIKKRYLLNTYRVLLTRARQGMMIFIPEGSKEDTTRLSKYYDGTFEYLKNIGIEEI